MPHIHDYVTCDNCKQNICKFCEYTHDCTQPKQPTPRAEIEKLMIDITDAALSLEGLSADKATFDIIDRYEDCQFRKRAENILAQVEAKAEKRGEKRVAVAYQKALLEVGKVSPGLLQQINALAFEAIQKEE